MPLGGPCWIAEIVLGNSPHFQVDPGIHARLVEGIPIKHFLRLELLLQFQLNVSVIKRPVDMTVITLITSDTAIGIETMA